MKTFVVLLVWLVLSAIIGFVGWQLHATLLVVVAAWLESDLPRPPGWATWTLAPISRASIFVLGSVWLMGVLWLERYLGSFPVYRVFWRRVGRLLLGLGGVLLVCWGIVWALS